MAQLPVPGVQGLHEWGLWRDGGVGGGPQVTVQAGLVGRSLHSEGLSLGLFTRGGQDRPDGAETDNTLPAQRCDWK